MPAVWDAMMHMRRRCKCRKFSCGDNAMTDILTFSYTFSWTILLIFWSRFHLGFFPGAHLTISHWFRKCLGTKKLITHHLYQWRPSSLTLRTEQNDRCLKNDTVKCNLSIQKLCIWILIALGKCLFRMFGWQQTTFGSGDYLTPNQPYAPTRTNDDPVHWRICASTCYNMHHGASLCQLKLSYVVVYENVRKHWCSSLEMVRDTLGWLWLFFRTLWRDASHHKYVPLFVSLKYLNYERW